MKSIRSLRESIDYLKESDELIVVKEEVDPIYELAAITKATDDGPAVLFENIKGYPDVRHILNVFGKKARLAEMFGCDSYEALREKCRAAIKKPVDPQIVDEAPCQEVVLTGRDLDVYSAMPVLRYSELDAGRIMSGGILMITGPYALGGSELAVKRMHFREKDWAAIAVNPHSHAGIIRYVTSRNEKIPMTINIGTPPAVTLTAAGSFLRAIVPMGSNELGFAGSLQGAPVDIVPAKTVEAYSIAQAEWVIEGYWLPEKVWETEGAERLGKDNLAPYFPEWTGYLGRARQVYKFQATAITHRKDRPIYWAPIAHSYDHDHILNCFRESCFIELFERVAPGFVTDVTIPVAFGSFGGLVIQVCKRRPLDEGMQREILLSAVAASPFLRTVIVVDEDVDIHNTDDLFWALNSRVDPDVDILRGPAGTKAFGMHPIEAGKGHGGTVMIDATVPLLQKDRFQRAKFLTEKIDLRKWFTDEQLQKINLNQTEYARLLAKHGW